MITISTLNGTAPLKDNDIVSLVDGVADGSNNETLVELMHYTKNQIDTFGAYRFIRGYIKSHPQPSVPDILKGRGLAKYKELLGSANPIMILGVIEGNSITFKVKFLQRIILDTEICTPNRTSRLSCRRIGDLSPSRVINGRDDELKIPSVDNVDSTFDKDSKTLYLYDLESRTNSGDIHEGKDVGNLHMRMPMSTIKTTQFVDVTDNKDYQEVYGLVVSEIIDAEIGSIQAAFPNITTINRWVFDLNAGGTIYNRDRRKDFTITDLT